ncbi:MAG: N-acetylmuramoyl-L-alanine amidase, partial [Oscillospiraceae bacterium]|nr:N-acetylmuramoyl-L-alanine amidase [Oscillospiraceae bacterium]
MKKKIELSMAVALILCAAVLAKKSSIFVQSPSPTPEEITIVIDAGHGGNDPGKVGINEALEKDINLSIALKLKDTLEAENLHIILTREDDSSLAPVDATNQKVADMQARCKLIEETNPLFTISIHQNSYITEEATGAQVFYYTQSDEGKKIAESLQESFLTNLDQTNTRETKSNDSYYLLKKTP